MLLAAARLVKGVKLRNEYRLDGYYAAGPVDYVALIKQLAVLIAVCALLPLLPCCPRCCTHQIRPCTAAGSQACYC